MLVALLHGDLAPAGQALQLLLAYHLKPDASAVRTSVRHESVSFAATDTSPV